MDDTKKRGRPQTKASDEGSDTGAGGSASTIPKKRGRPSNPEKVRKPPSGRGRGRPAKNAPAGGAPKRTSASEEDGGKSVSNGDGATAAPTAPGRGRPPKQGKLKITHSIEATGKGRGRPKNPPKSDNDDEQSEDDAEGDDDDEDGQSSGYKPGGARNPKKAKLNKTKSPKKAGRPKKIANSDDEDDNDSEEDDERNLGRPATGAVNLNIARTGRGQGRPKKAVAEKRGAAEAVEGVANGVPKKRGRPATSKVGSYVATGKPRGRPKASDNNTPRAADSPTEKESDVEDNDDDDVENVSDSEESYAENITDNKKAEVLDTDAADDDLEPIAVKELSAA